MRGFACVGVISAVLAGQPLAGQEKLVSEGDEWRYLKGLEEPPADWAMSSFDDASWSRGAMPIGYGPDLPFATVLDDMQSGYWTVYCRKTFEVPAASVVKSLFLDIKYDDGFVCYINGREVLRKAMPQGAPSHQTAATDHETNVSFETSFLPCDALSALLDGTNVIAVEVHNATLASSDCALSLELSAVTSSSCPTELTCLLRANNVVFLRWSRPVGVSYEALALERDGVALQPGPVPTALSFSDRTASPGAHSYRLVATVCGAACTGAGVTECSVQVPGDAAAFRRGDVDQNGSIGINDPVLLLNSLFRDAGPPACLDSADADDNGEAQITDAVFLLRYLFQGGGPPPPPLDACGADPTEDGLGACDFAGCSP